MYHLKCECGQDYIGETERQLKDRLAEHCRKSSVEKSAMANHLHSAKHKLMSEHEILDQEPDWHKRGIKEAIHIRRQKPSLNKDEGRHHLPSVWNDLILGAPRGQDHQQHLSQNQSQITSD